MKIYPPTSMLEWAGVIAQLAWASPLGGVEGSRQREKM